MDEIIENEILEQDIDPTEEPTIEPEPFVIPDVYIYSELTNEYIGKKQAEIDPEESKVQGHFVPLVPKFATLLEVPEYGENEIPVFENEQWVVKPNYRQNFYKVDENLNVYPIETIGEQEGFIVVAKETGEDIKENKDYYKIVDGEIIKKSDEEYEAEQEIKERERINNLTCTKRVFALGLQQMGMSYSQLKELISTNEQAQLEWDLCIELERSNPLIDTMAQQFGFESEKIDEIFIKANM